MSAVFVLAAVVARHAVTIAAQHDVTVAADRVVVQTRWSDRSVADDQGVVDLVVPLLPGAAIEGAEVRRDDDDRIVALRIDPARANGPEVRVVVPLTDVEADGALPLPIATRSRMQRVAIDESLVFRPDPALGLALHLGHTLPQGMRTRQREAIDDLLGISRARLGAVYVDADAIGRAGGVVGAIEAGTAGRRRAAIATAAVFVVLCGAGAVAYRRARRSAEAEHAELLLEAEIDALDRRSERPG
jgi:hypothetical protein